MFCSVEDVADLLQITLEDADYIYIERAINEATEAIKIYTQQEITARSETITIDCPGGSRIFLPELPVNTVSKVIEDEEELTATTDYKLGQHGILYRVNGYWSDGIQNVVITYSHGYSTIPQIIKDVCTRAAARAFQAGKRSKETEGVLGVSATSLGDYSVSYGQESSSGEGLLGVSAARILLLSEKDMLNKYRYRSL